MALIATSSSIPTRPTYSCIRCADRKVKCDRRIPCSTCTRRNIDCVYDSSQPPRNRHKKRVADQILADRLRHYEALLREKGIDPKESPRNLGGSEPHRRSSPGTEAVSNELQSHNPSAVEPESSRSVNQTQVIRSRGNVKIVDNILWTRMVEEFHDAEDALGGSSNEASDAEESDDDFAVVLGSQPKSDTGSRHPPPRGIRQLWQIFTENIDPLTKVIHIPTLQPAIEKAASDIKAIPQSFEALMFAIYSAAVMSLSADECVGKLGESRKVLLARYVSATKTALSRAKFMGSTSLVVLQALILHLLSVRDIYEPRAVWALTGVAIRIAHGMGLERDGASLGLPAFETEMRRRAWWALKTHDFRTAELCGMAKFRDLHTGAESTKWPTNVNDDQLYPGMPSPAAQPSTLTDAVFVALKYELFNCAAGRIADFRRRGKPSGEWELHTPGTDIAEGDRIVREIEELLETRYLRYCDPSHPLHLMAMLMARSAVNLMRFLSHHPRRWTGITQTPLPERRWVWDVSVKLLEQHDMLQSNPQLRRFAWHAPYFQQWQAIIHVLDTLRADPLTAVDADKAWKLVERTYDNNPEMATNMRKPIHLAVGNLCLKAYGDRNATLQNTNTHAPPTPRFISQLRQQHDIAKARRQARQQAKGSGAEDLVSDGQTAPLDSESRPDHGVIDLSDTLESTYLQRSTAEYHSGQTQPSHAPEMDPFWLTYGFGDGRVGDTNEDVVNINMDLDLDFTTDQDHGMTDDAVHTTRWDQWDSWLADSYVIGPPSSNEIVRG